EATPLQGLQVTASSAGQELGSWQGDTGPDGIAEVRIEAAAQVHGALSLRIARAGAPLADATLLLRSPPPPVVGSPAIAGTTSAAEPHPGLGPSAGDLDIRVETSRGVLAAPFPDQLRISVADKGPTGRGLRADLEVSAPGADLSLEKLSTD